MIGHQYYIDDLSFSYFIIVVCNLFAFYYYYYLAAFLFFELNESKGRNQRQAQIKFRQSLIQANGHSNDAIDCEMWFNSPTYLDVFSKLSFVE